MQLGEDGRFGQAELFADEPACAAKLASAVPLDDSRELIMSKCDGVKLAVDTDEVVCGASVCSSISYSTRRPAIDT